MPTNQATVIHLIEQNPEGLDDDEISEQTGIQPRQQVYQICRRLAAEGRIRRTSVEKSGKRRKIHNFPADTPPTIEIAPGRGSSVAAKTAWRRRLSMLVAATGRTEEEILDDALRDLSIKLLSQEFAE